jgi:monoamine oxidase
VGHERLFELARAVGVTPREDRRSGDSLFFNEKWVRYSGDLPPMVAEESGAYDRAVGALDRLAAYSDGEVRALDGMSLSTWMEREIPERKIREYLELRFALGFTVPSARMSALHAARFLRSTGGWAQYRVDMTWVLDPGAFEVVGRLALQLESKIVLGHPVRRIVQDSDEVWLSGEDVNVICRQAIIAMGPAEARAVKFEPNLPPGRAVLHNAWQAGTAIKVHARYDEPFWRGDGLSGYTFALGGNLPMTFDCSPFDNSSGILGALIVLGADDRPDGDPFMDGDANARREMVLHGFAERFGEAALDVRAFHERRWTDDPETVGCVGVAPPGLLRNIGGALREPFGRLHWAGTESADRWTGWMEGAIQAGERAADEVLSTGVQN